MRTLLLIALMMLLALPVKPQNADEPEAVLTSDQLNDFRDHAQRVISQLGNYVRIIANKSAEDARRRSTDTMAVGLFQSDTNTVQVSSLHKKDPDFLTVGDYFWRLYKLEYVQVDIKWYGVYLSPEFTREDDGRYHGVATVYQKFTGTTSREWGGGKYIDITKKNIQIVIEQVEEKVGDKIVKKWRLFLGDINVEATRPG